MRMTTRALGLVAGFAGLVGIASGAQAQSAADDDRLDVLSRAAARSNAGDHLGAIDLYQRVYRGEEDLDLLVTIGAEYHKAGKSAEALQNYCTYLSLEPQGERAPFAQSEVISLKAERGLGVDFANVCAPAQPMLPPLAPATVDREQPTTNSDQAQPALVRPQLVLPARDGMSQREKIGIGTIGAGLLSLTVGVVYGRRAGEISDQIVTHDPAQAWPANIRELEDRGQHAERMEGIFLISSAVALGTGTYLYVTGRHHRLATEQRVTVAPSVSRAAAGLAISGSF